MTQVHGCSINPFSDGTALIAWVNGNGNEVAAAADTSWLLAYCDDGVVWGKWDSAQKQWLLSNVSFPKVSPLLTKVNLQQLRVFGPNREVLVWRVEDGLNGRVLVDSADPTDNSLRTKTEKHILVGDRLLDGPVGEFSLVGDASGSRHAIPLACEEKDFKDGNRTRWPLRLQVKHYFTQDDTTGVVRIAVSRLVKVWNAMKEKD